MARHAVNAATKDATQATVNAAARAARDTGAAAGNPLLPTELALQRSAVGLIHRMIAVRH